MGVFVRDVSSLLILALVAKKSGITRVPKTLLNRVELLQHNPTELLHGSNKLRLVTLNGLLKWQARRSYRVVNLVVVQFLLLLHVLIK